MRGLFQTWLQWLGMGLLILSLSACVIDTRPDVGSGSYKPKTYDIDSDIEDDFDRALRLLNEQKYDEAIQILEAVVKVEKRVPAPFVNLGMAYDKKGDRKKAEQYLLEAVNVDLSHPIANNQLGLLYRRDGRFEDAKKAYRNALTKSPDYLPVIKNLGILCELYLRDLACALEQYEHYQRLRPDDKTMKIWISDVSRRLGK